MFWLGARLGARAEAVPAAARLVLVGKSTRARSTTVTVSSLADDAAKTGAERKWEAILKDVAKLTTKPKSAVLEAWKVEQALVREIVAMGEERADEAKATAAKMLVLSEARADEAKARADEAKARADEAKARADEERDLRQQRMMADEREIARLVKFRRNLSRGFPSLD